ncbi:Serpin B5 [Myotis davidii]|uniref:Serpin B5 n=1 Tax=Myotis davidii TaxID=225400 RepID=L5MB33_MYODS|nr:Serpin B5 [Myotis davidii]
MDALQLANSAFAVDLFKKLCEQEPAGNVLFSPICLSTSLSLVQVGAKGDTANEIGQVLHFENVKDVPFGFQTVTSDVNKLSSFYSLKLIKRLYVDKSLNPSTEFISCTKRPYAKELETVDFKDKLEETKGQINNSIKDLTDGKYFYLLCLCHFENILSNNNVNDQTKILVVNAAYFIGKWMKKFPESETKECPFRVNKTDTKPVQMMNLEAMFCMGNIDSINCKVIELPFQNKHLSMLILLPKDMEDESTGLEKVEKQLNSETLLQWTNPSTMANTKVKLSIPKFKVEKMIDPKASLENLGLKSTFDESTSDFSGMSETKGVTLSKVIHRVCLEISEDGGDSIEVPGSRILQHKDEFRADHPFIYIVRHNKTRNIVFFGKFCSP